MHNPEFYERQRMRASTYNIPRFLYSFDETIDGSLVLPRGMLGTIASLAEQAGSWVKITDERAAGTPQQFQVQRDADCSAASGCRRTDPARPRHACRAARLGRGSHPVRLRPVALRNPAEGTGGGGRQPVSSYPKWDRDAYIERVGGPEEAERRRKTLMARQSRHSAGVRPASTKASAGVSQISPDRARPPQPP
jgi:hypothetical protein